MGTPQVYCKSPTIYNQAICDSLTSLQLSPSTAVIQYMDDPLVAAPSKEPIRHRQVSQTSRTGRPQSQPKQAPIHLSPRHIPRARDFQNQQNTLT